MRTKALREVCNRKEERRPVALLHKSNCALFRGGNLVAPLWSSEENLTFEAKRRHANLSVVLVQRP